MIFSGWRLLTTFEAAVDIIADDEVVRTED